MGGKKNAPKSALGALGNSLQLPPIAQSPLTVLQSTSPSSDAYSSQPENLQAPEESHEEKQEKESQVSSTLRLPKSLHKRLGIHRITLGVQQQKVVERAIGWEVMIGVELNELFEKCNGDETLFKNRIKTLL